MRSWTNFYENSVFSVAHAILDFFTNRPKKNRKTFYQIGINANSTMFNKFLQNGTFPSTWDISNKSGHFPTNRDILRKLNHTIKLQNLNCIAQKCLKCASIQPRTSPPVGCFFSFKAGRIHHKISRYTTIISTSQQDFERCMNKRDPQWNIRKHHSN